MAQIVLSQAGAAIGATALPSGLTVFGQTIAGAAIGRAIGSVAGRAIDASLAPPLEGARIKTLHIMESREGAGLPTLYGRMRVGGQVIWASQFLESRKTRSAGKGGPKYTEYSYTVSFAVALCQGPITRVDRIWANGETLSLAGLNWRLYRGGEDQLPDPIIEAIEGAGEAPAYRGTAYIVFEDFPLDAFGNRLPQLSFEVVRAGTERAGDLRSEVHGINIIPATGEFVYGTQIVRERRFPGIERALNMNNSEGRADFEVSIDQLKSDLPVASSATLTVAWFADSATAGSCKIRPGVETRERNTVPYGWTVDGVGRSEAHLISGSETAASFGGTPADQCVLEGIAALKQAGLGVTMSPFLLVDAPGFPWRGRITVAADSTAAARSEIEDFVGDDGAFGFRHFILHHARLAAQSAAQGFPVDTFLIGSEMVGLTRIRDDAGAFPFVEALRELAQEARTILGAGVAISYAADWTEYGAYAPADGSNDVLFPLDALWADPFVDFVGIDWYPPVGDWRDGDQHLDALAGYSAADDPSYLQANMAGGEAYDWYYADQAARDGQDRTTITDTAFGEDWIFRAKDIAGWWNAAHFARPGGVREAAPTAWVPGSKPVRLIEIGFPAIDRGGNAPNLFYDPKSTESAFPPHSSGKRDDLFQRRALIASLQYWQSQPFVEQVAVWAWDARPWPDYPIRESVWSDGPNWQFGHWLNGRTGLIELSDVVGDICARANVNIDVTRLEGFVEGYGIDGVTSLRQALAPLSSAFGLNFTEAEGTIVASHANHAPLVSMAMEDVLEPGTFRTRTLLDKAPGRLLLTYLNGDGTYQPAIAEARLPDRELDYTVRLAMPMVIAESRATELAGDLLAQSVHAESLHIAFGPAAMAVEAGDVISLDGQEVWQVADVSERGLQKALELVPAGLGSDVLRASNPERLRDLALVPATPELIIIDGPPITGFASGVPLIAAAADPWLSSVPILAGPDAATLSQRAVVQAPAQIGQLMSPLASGPVGRWDDASVLDLELVGGDLSSQTSLAALNEGGSLLIQTAEGWELVSYRTADLVGTDRWHLSGLLRGLAGSEALGAPAGAVVVQVDGNLVEATFAAAERGLSLVWQAGDAAPVAFRYDVIAERPWSVAHLTAIDGTGGVSLSWVRRGSDISDSWTLPEAPNVGRFRVEAWLGGQILTTEDVDTASAMIAHGADLVRVAEVGADGRVGVWSSIPLNAA